MSFTSINIALIQFPGSNCERETKMAIERAGMHACDYFWNDPNVDLAIFDGYVIIGGFSYEDRGRSGLIAAKAALLDKLKVEAQKGKPVIGICNGAQVLVESGLVPGLKDHQLGMALTLNKRVRDGEVIGTGFYNDWCHIKPLQKNRVFGRHFDEAIRIPFAHAEGRFVMATGVLEALKSAGASLWQYCDENPNGSVESLAAVSNPAGNVLAIMPHPERTPNGDVIFQSMHDYIREGEPVEVQPLDLALSVQALKQFQQEAGYSVIVKTIITDNEAVSVNKAIHQLGVDVEIERFTHWQVDGLADEKSAVIASDELFNPNKEMMVEDLPADSFYVLVRHDFDSKGRHTKDVLKRQCGIELNDLKAGTLWRIKTQDRAVLDQLIDWNLFANPVADEQAVLS